MIRKLTAALAALPLAAAIFATPAQAAAHLTFNSKGAQVVELTPAGDEGTLVSIAPNTVMFSFHSLDGVAFSPALQNLSAQFQMNLVRLTGTNAYSGTFSFTYTGATVSGDGYTVQNGANLLSGTITDAYLWGLGELNAYSNIFPADLEVQSDILPLVPSPGSHNRFSMSLMGPDLPTPGQRYVSSIQGSFTSGIPEPATWAMMIAGFGLAGVRVRRQRYGKVTAAPVV